MWQFSNLKNSLKSGGSSITIIHCPKRHHVLKSTFRSLCTPPLLHFRLFKVDRTEIAVRSKQRAGIDLTGKLVMDLKAIGWIRGLCTFVVAADKPRWEPDSHVPSGLQASLGCFFRKSCSFNFAISPLVRGNACRSSATTDDVN